jgi:2-polyprenyl-3-methyl-5-hydroxy-6-metoxy-1,4-benzoquinol methylase
MFAAGLGAAELMIIHLGVRLGLYEALADRPTTAEEIAVRAGIGQRYAIEWLEQQAASGIVEVDDAAAPALERRYRLPAGHRQVLVDGGSASPAVALAVLPLAGVAPLLPRLAEAFREDAGVPYADYGDAFHDIQEQVNRAVFDEQLARWIRMALPDVHQRLSCPGAAIADTGCGSGWSSIALARAYPSAVVRGFDLNQEAIGRARQHTLSAGLGDRVGFEVTDMAEDEERTTAEGGFDLVCILDALHDLARPVEVLRNCRRILSPEGCVLLMEPRAAAAFTAPADDIERFLYSVSLLHCLPVSLAQRPSAATGTVLRPETVARFAADAGFRSAQVLPVEHQFHRLYRLD